MIERARAAVLMTAGAAVGLCEATKIEAQILVSALGHIEGRDRTMLGGCSSCPMNRPSWNAFGTDQMVF
jgi:hypothetical protein